MNWGIVNICKDSVCQSASVQKMPFGKLHWTVLPYVLPRVPNKTHTFVIKSTMIISVGF